MKVTNTRDDRDEVISSPLFARVRSNIEAKLTILRSWIGDDALPWLSDEKGVPIRNGDGELVLDYFPRNIKNFASWDGSQNCAFVRGCIAEVVKNHNLVKIYSFGRKTLYQSYHSDLESQARATFKTLESLAERQMQRYNKTNQIILLTKELQYYKDLRQQQDTEIVQYRNQLREFENVRRQETIKREEGDREYARIIEDLTQQNAALLRTLSKLAPLHVTDKQ